MAAKVTPVSDLSMEIVARNIATAVRQALIVATDASRTLDFAAIRFLLGQPHQRLLLEHPQDHRALLWRALLVTLHQTVAVVPALDTHVWGLSGAVAAVNTATVV